MSQHTALAPAAPPTELRLLRGWRWLLASALLNTLVALALTLAGTGHDDGLYAFGINVVYSQCIGLTIWFLIDRARVWLTPDESRQWRRLLGIVPAGVVLGYLAGTLAADTLLGGSSGGVLSALPSRKGAGLLLMSLAIGVACTYYFMTQARLARVREEAARASLLAEAAQRQAAESQLKLLQTQLEPHMLFNTLANLRVLVGLDPIRAQAMLDHLIAYLRGTLGASRATMHPLQTEFDRLRDYLALMSVRMGPRLSYTLDLPQALGQQPVPPLLLQPLVENSIRHGLEPKVAGGHVSISARLNGQMLTLTVTDTGTGLTESGQGSGAAGAKGVECEVGVEGGFGLGQVRERLHTCYGDLATFEIADQPSGGTCVSITLPASFASPP